MRYEDDDMPALAEARQEIMVPGGKELNANQMRSAGSLFGGEVVVAQKVIARRDYTVLQQQMKQHAAMFGDEYMYSWKAGGDTIEGPTIKLANDLARLFGNCDVDVRCIHLPEHWEFYARFTDKETGFTLTRAFQQRKSQRAGKKMDADRALDIAYQIGQSKAIRNVVINALSGPATFMQEEAKSGLLDKIAKNQTKYDEAITRGLAHFDIDVKMVERVVGRSRADWNVRDIARVFHEFKALGEGQISKDELYGGGAPQVQQRQEQQQDSGSGKSPAGGAEASASKAAGGGDGQSPRPPAASANKKAAPEPEPEREMDPEAEQDQQRHGAHDDAPQIKQPEPKATAKKTAPKPSALFPE